MPAYPVGLSLVAVVAERILIFHQQAVSGTTGASYRAAKISQGEVVVAAGRGGGGCVFGFSVGGC